MAYLNSNYLKLKSGYLFPEIARRVSAFASQYPEKAKRLIRCGIGDVTEPLPEAARNAMLRAVQDMGQHSTFRGYGPEQGYEFLRSKIAEFDYRSRGISIADDEIFVSDGSKCDCANILDIFSHTNCIAVMDPVYPVYVDTNVMAGHTGPADASGAYYGLLYLPCLPENHFVPSTPNHPVDLIYLCFPNNPTGAVASLAQLQKWVDFALANDSIILYDAAYEAFIRDPALPHSIYEIPGATKCAIEFRSFSKNAGFTGVRCAYTVVPKTLTARDESGNPHPLHPLWARRFSTKFNGVSYITQRAAEALYSDEGRQQIAALIDHYMGNADILRKALLASGLLVYGGENAPYLWVKCPTGLTSWQTFDLLLNEAQIVVTPGSGFGAAGEGFFRVSAFNSRQNAIEAASRLANFRW
ncbi:MAG: LL-diaminopimelate aminotransferase [Chthoniobacterales bacterium]|nr:LL-diaminopimelate aminotransferase [Chthoniobacterales bacterium]